MKLERLELYNFRQYYGQQRVTFSTDPQRHVTVIHGVNGAGKTSMFLGLNWCLYGKEVLDNLGELVSKEALSKVKAGNLVETWVQLAFSHEGQRYILRRTMGAVRRIDGVLDQSGNEDLTLRRIGADGQAVKENSPVSTINAILPANVRSYFLFDGEKIDDFAKPEAASEVKEAIRLVLRLEILDRARRHLESMQRQYRKELTDVSGNEQLKELEKQISEAENAQQTAQERLDEVKSEEALARQRWREIDDQLSQDDGVKELQKERKEAEKELKSSRKHLEELIHDIQAKASAAYLVQGQPIIAKALKILDEKRARGQIPSNIRQQFVQDLLEQKMCICGRPLAAHTNEEQMLHNLLKESVSASLENTVLDTNNVLITLRERGRNHAKDIRQLMKTRVNTIGQIEVLEGKLSDLELKLKDYPEEDVRNLEKKREEFKADIDNCRFEQGELSEKIRRLSDDIEELDRQIAKARKYSKLANKLDRKMTLAKEGAKAIEETYQKFADEMREQIEQQANEIFRSLIWKESHFEKLRLGEDYNLEIIDRYGATARSDLSAGERQVLSLSFIAAMAQVSGEEAPLVMDTPFGRLSSQHRNSITEKIPRLASQMVLFVTDEELRDQARINLEPYIGYEYRLDFDSKTSCTEVMEL